MIHRDQAAAPSSSYRGECPHDLGHVRQNLKLNFKIQKKIIKTYCVGKEVFAVRIVFALPLFDVAFPQFAFFDLLFL